MSIQKRNGYLFFALTQRRSEHARRTNSRKSQKISLSCPRGNRTAREIFIICQSSTRFSALTLLIYRPKPLTLVPSNVQIIREQNSRIILLQTFFIFKLPVQKKLRRFRVRLHSQRENIYQRLCSHVFLKNFTIQCRSLWSIALNVIVHGKIALACITKLFHGSSLLQNEALLITTM